MVKTRHARTSQANFPKRGEIYLTALDPTLGHEIQKTRPAVIIQNDVSNRLTEMTIVAPITSTVRFPLNPTCWRRTKRQGYRLSLWPCSIRFGPSTSSA